MRPKWFHLGVAVTPRVEEYCNVWQDWSSTNHHATEIECCSVWKGILKHWLLSPSEVETIVRAKGLKFPIYYGRQGSYKFKAATDVVVPNDLTLTALFKDTGAKDIFAWYPNPSAYEIPMDSLFSLYNSLGVKNISEVVGKNEVSISNDKSLLKPQKGEGFLSVGLYGIVLAYLAYPSFNISVAKRHAMVMTLSESSVYEIAEPMKILYFLTLKTENGDPEDIVACAPSFFRWEKRNKKILTHPYERDNPKMRLSLAIEIAEVVSKGLLSEHYPGLVDGLCKMLKMWCLLEFDDRVFDDRVFEEILQHKNMQLFEEDMDLFARKCFVCRHVKYCEIWISMAQ